MKTAQQLREITLSNKIGIEEIVTRAESMASSGHRFWASELHKIDLTDNVKSKLMELGFTITTNEEYNHFKISW